MFPSLLLDPVTVSFAKQRTFCLDHRLNDAVDSPLKSCAISSDGARVFLGDMSGCVHFLQLEGG